MSDTTTTEPMLRLPASALLAIHRVAAHERGPADAARLVRQLGCESGEGFHQAFRDWLADREGGASPDALPAGRFWEALGDFFADTGWGELRYEPVHPGVVSLSSRGWTEAEGAGGARHPACHFTTGLLADLLTRVAGADLAVLEVECRAGGDEQCRFLLGSPDVLDRVYAGMRAGQPYAAALESLG